MPITRVRLTAVASVPYPNNARAQAGSTSRATRAAGTRCASAARHALVVGERDARVRLRRRRRGVQPVPVAQRLHGQAAGRAEHCGGAPRQARSGVVEVEEKTGRQAAAARPRDPDSEKRGRLRITHWPSARGGPPPRGSCGTRGWGASDARTLRTKASVSRRETTTPRAAAHAPLQHAVGAEAALAEAQRVEGVAACRRASVCYPLAPAEPFVARSTHSPAMVPSRYGRRSAPGNHVGSTSTAAADAPFFVAAQTPARLAACDTGMATRTEDLDMVESILADDVWRVGRRRARGRKRNKIFRSGTISQQSRFTHCLSKNVLGFKTIKRSRPENDVLKRET